MKVSGLVLHADPNANVQQEVAKVLHHLGRCPS